VFIGRMLDISNLNLKAELNRLFGFGESETDLPRTFPHDMLTLMIDWASSPPMFVFDEHCPEELLERVVADEKAQKTLVMSASGSQNHFTRKVSEMLGEELAQFTTVRLPHQ
jgi:hypothetical protein